MRTVFLLFTLIVSAQATCSGKFPNIITDVCWECIFPIRIGGVNVTPGHEDGSKAGGSPICVCPKPPLMLPTPGIRVSYWEPVRLVDVTRTPYCLVNLGGIKVGSSSSVKDRGTIALTDGEGGLKNSFFHVHWYVFPLFYVFELFTDFSCVEKASMDLAHLTEFDPFWDNDEFALLQNPEAILFGNPISHGACSAECLKLSAGYGLDSLFWCAGCHGSLYPFTGSVSSHVTSVQATELVATKFMAKMHRYGLMQAYVGPGSDCGKVYAPIIKKSMYRLQMLNPLPATRKSCHSIGKSDFLHPRHRERELLKGASNYGYLVWRHRQCCLL
jgi:conjugal transfer pilus assembly protein TraU